MPGPDAVAGPGTGAGAVVGAGVAADGDVVVVAVSSRLPQPTSVMATNEAINKDLFMRACSPLERRVRPSALRMAWVALSQAALRLGRPNVNVFCVKQEKGHRGRVTGPTL